MEFFLPPEPSEPIRTHQEAKDSSILRVLESRSDGLGAKLLALWQHLANFASCGV